VTAPRLVLRGLGQRHAGRQVLRDVDMVIEPGETVGITGPSGAGKSTLARLLTLHESPSDGRLEVDGEDCATWNRARLRERRRLLQLVPPDPGLSFAARWPLWRVVAEGLLIDGCSHARARVAALEVLRKVGIEGDGSLSPLQLSGGERRRAAIARALLAQSRLLVFDESFAGLDPPRQDEIVDLLRELQAQHGLTLVTITHELRLLRRIGGRVLILDAGIAVEDGPAERVLTLPASAAGGRLCAAEYRLEVPA
jgi:ABC-type dipeptide/oligopeptide/nickel transport system ATPase subunit